MKGIPGNNVKNRIMGKFFLEAASMLPKA